MVKEKSSLGNCVYTQKIELKNCTGQEKLKPHNKITHEGKGIEFD